MKSTVISHAEGLRWLPAADFQDCLRDESRRGGRAETISFPTCEDELRADMGATARAGIAVTIQSARTGITGGAVPDGGHIINLSRMKRILNGPHPRAYAQPERQVMTVEPGVTLAELRTILNARLQPGAASEHRLFFPPDPTETSAAIGGMIANNASGALSFAYGPTRGHIGALRIILADGDLLVLRRGAHKARGRAFSLRTESGKLFAGDLPTYRMPGVKNASGYYAADDMDLLDLFVGAEGTLGVISAAELILQPQPGRIAGILCFFDNEPMALRFVMRMRAATPRPVAIEFFDAHVLSMLREQKQQHDSLAWLPELPSAWHTGIYVEYHAAGASEIAAALEGLCACMEAAGGDSAATWIGDTPDELQRQKQFRHAVPECVNRIIDERRRAEPRLIKLGTDLAVPDQALDEIMALYHDGLSRLDLQHVIFGHIGDNHVHVNILPRDLGDYEHGRALYREWALRVVALGGSVSAEHGIGKLKRELLLAMYGADGIAQMRRVKRCFDPAFRLNRGNLFDPG